MCRLPAQTIRPVTRARRQACHVPIVPAAIGVVPPVTGWRKDRSVTMLAFANPVGCLAGETSEVTHKPSGQPPAPSARSAAAARRVVRREQRRGRRLGRQLGYFLRYISLPAARQNTRARWTRAVRRRSVGCAANV